MLLQAENHQPNQEPAEEEPLEPPLRGLAAGTPPDSPQPEITQHTPRRRAGQIEERRLIKLHTRDMTSRLRDRVADQFLAQQFGSHGGSIVQPGQPEPAGRDRQEEPDPERMPSPDRPGLRRFSLPE